MGKHYTHVCTLLLQRIYSKVYHYTTITTIPSPGIVVYRFRFGGKMVKSSTATRLDKETATNEQQRALDGTCIVRSELLQQLLRAFIFIFNVVRRARAPSLGQKRQLQIDFEWIVKNNRGN